MTYKFVIGSSIGVQKLSSERMHKRRRDCRASLLRSLIYSMSFYLKEIILFKYTRYIVRGVPKKKLPVDHKSLFSMLSSQKEFWPVKRFSHVKSKIQSSGKATWFSITNRFPNNVVLLHPRTIIVCKDICEVQRPSGSCI